MANVVSEEALREADCRDNRQSLAEEKRHERQKLLNFKRRILLKFINNFDKNFDCFMNFFFSSKPADA